MNIELKVPEVGESITEVEIGEWLKAVGEPIRKDEPVVTLESEKATVELPAPEAGVVTQVLKKKGEVAKVGEVIAILEKDGAAGVGVSEKVTKAEEKAEGKPTEPSRVGQPRSRTGQGVEEPKPVSPTRGGGGVAEEDVVRQVEEASTQAAPLSASAPGSPVREAAARGGAREEEVVPMSRLRRTVAERLVRAQHEAALLTTFNEIDLASVLALRKEFGEIFYQKYQVKLGMMSFFVKASIDALKQFPSLNAEIRETSIVYHNYCDIGVAVGSGKGLVVPVLRNAERMSFAEIEMAVGDFGRRAKDNKLRVQELQGGTFTISNGGVYGSLLSTPIINPPQSGVLGLHAIQERPVAREGAVVIRPMMYVALTYDHRVVDGREAVSFLKRIKEGIETPARMLLEV
jgi:2-oxoglutarate dehydrogenase E2 component (dihydrolipoamide succinyltransferase)